MRRRFTSSLEVLEENRPKGFGHLLQVYHAAGFLLRDALGQDHFSDELAHVVEGLEYCECALLGH